MDKKHNQNSGKSDISYRKKNNSMYDKPWAENG